MQILEKLVVFGVMMLAVATISFQWLERMTINPMLETALALLIVPFFVNVIWFWIVDNLLMRSRRLQQRDSEDTTPYNPDAFVAPPSSLGIDGDATTANSSDGTSGIGTVSSCCSPESLLRASRPSVDSQRRSSGGGISKHAPPIDNTGGGVPFHVHTGSVRYGKLEVDRNRWGEADTLLLNQSLSKPKYRNNCFSSTSIDFYAAADDPVGDVLQTSLLNNRYEFTNAACFKAVVQSKLAW